MAGTESKERAAIAAVYSTYSWKDKVKHMSDAQVTAVYLRFLRDGKIKN